MAGTGTITLVPSECVDLESVRDVVRPITERVAVDLTKAATPMYFTTMGLEHRLLQRRAERVGPSAADYEPHDTRASLAMGVLSAIVPVVSARLLRRFGRPGRARTALVATAVGAVAITAVADVLATFERTPHQCTDALDRRADAGISEPSASAVEANRTRRRAIARAARTVASVGGVTAIATAGIAITSTWANRVNVDRFWERRVVPDLGSGPGALVLGILGWDFIYYWNHRFMHSSRYLWAIHAVHHSSERYNLSTALRQPVADALGTFVPYGLLAGLGIRPSLIAHARGINLLYQYWIHTETIRSIGPAEAVLNTASHHRVHHGSNRQYLDRNHASIFIVWDKWFGTFEPEVEPVVYGLTKNIDTFNPVRVIVHEHDRMLRDVARSTSWIERLNVVLRGPGWSYARYPDLTAPAVA